MSWIIYLHISLQSHIYKESLLRYFKITIIFSAIAIAMMTI